MKRNVNLTIVSHKIALAVEEQDEPSFRDAATRVNDLYKQYQRAYPQLTSEQLWAYVSLALAVELEQDSRDKAVEPLLERVRRLTEKIESGEKDFPLTNV